MVAFEMAQQLTRAGERVGLLALHDTQGPGYPKLRSNAAIRFHLFRSFGIRLPQSPDRGWTDLGHELFNIWRARFFMRMRKMRGETLTPESVYFNFLLVAIRASQRYRPSAYAGRITLLRHTNQPSPELYHPDAFLGWKDLAAGGLDIIDVLGAHGLARTHDLGDLSEKLRERIRFARLENNSADSAAAD